MGESTNLSRSQITIAAATAMVLLSGIVAVFASSVDRADVVLGTDAPSTTTSEVPEPDDLPGSGDATTSTSTSTTVTSTTSGGSTSTTSRVTTTTGPTTTSTTAATTTTTAATTTTTTTLAKGPKPSHPVYAVEKDGSGVIGLVAMDGNGENRRTLRASTGVRSPDLSPDGTFLLFRDGQGRVARVNVDGGGYTVLAEAFLFQAPRISPDGTRFVVSEIPTNGTVPRLVTYAIDGSNRTELSIPSERNPTQVDWSPDGSKLIYTAGTLTKLYVFAFSDSSSTAIDDGSNRAMLDPRWAPAGDVIAFHHEGRLYTMPAAGGSWSVVTPEGIDSVDNPSWEPTGTLLFDVQDGSVGLRRINRDGSGSFPVTGPCCLDPAA